MTNKPVVTPLGIGTVVPSTISMLIIELTPDDCRAILEGHLHPNQRKINDNQVARYLTAMLNEQWDEPPYTFDVLAFDEDGRVVNGQHRLKAGSLQNQTLRFIALFGIQTKEDKALPRGDTGIVRPKWLVEGEERELWQVANFMVDLARGIGGGRVSEDEVVATCRWIEEAHSHFQRQSKMVPVPVQAGFIVRWLMLDPDSVNPERREAIRQQRLELEENWRNYIAMNLHLLPVEYMTLYKRLQADGVAKGSTKRVSQYASTLYALSNPGALKIFSNDLRARETLIALLRTHNVIRFPSREKAA